MLPNDTFYTVVGQDTIKMPNKTYFLDMQKKRIRGFLNDDLAAVKQAVYLILRTERFDWLIYSRNYGIELKELFGREKSYVIPMLIRNISEALLADRRIVDVRDFNFTVNRGGKYSVSFNVASIYGDFMEEVVLDV